MMRLLDFITTFGAALVVASFAASAQASPAVWKSYLCRYDETDVVVGGHSSRTALVKVNEKDGRVLIRDEDANAVKIDDKTIHFETGAGPWSINKATGEFFRIRSTVRSSEIGRGTCKVVDN